MNSNKNGQLKKHDEVSFVVFEDIGEPPPRVSNEARQPSHQIQLQAKPAFRTSAPLAEPTPGRAHKTHLSEPHLSEPNLSEPNLRKMHLQRSEAQQVDPLTLSSSSVGLGVVAGTIGVVLSYAKPWRKLPNRRSPSLKQSESPQQSRLHLLRSSSDKSLVKNRFKGTKLETETHSDIRLDPLTGLLSRSQLLDIGDRILSGARVQTREAISKSAVSDTTVSDNSLTLICININQFNIINAELGIEAGDELLCALSDRLRENTPLDSTYIARIGSDEFALLTEMSNVDAQQMTKELLLALNRPVRLKQSGGSLSETKRSSTEPLPADSSVTAQSVTVNCRAGIAIAKAASLHHFSELLSQATIAMSAGKPSVVESTSTELAATDQTSNGQSLNGQLADQSEHKEIRKYGRSRLVQFDSTMAQEMKRQSTLARSLSGRIPYSQLRAYYQPIVDLSYNRLPSESNVSYLPFKTIGFEALIRWQHPERGLLLPAQFLPIAEKMGLMLEIDRWMMETVCQQLSDWQRPDLVVNVNLSANHLMEADLVAHIQQLLKRYPILPQQLNLEITEGELIADLDKAVNTLHQIRDMGLSISLDDFGSGYSSLSYLHRLPADTIKIDQSFIYRLSAEADRKQGRQRQTAQPSLKATQTIVKAILELAADLNIRVVAEGIEQVEQVEWLRGMRCGYGQGFLFSKPTSARLATKILQQRNYYSIEQKSIEQKIKQKDPLRRQAS